MEKIRGMLDGAYRKSFNDKTHIPHQPSSLAAASSLADSSSSLPTPPPRFPFGFESDSGCKEGWTVE